MQLQCALCHKNFSITQVVHNRGKGLSAQIQCPHCHAWLGRNRLLTTGKIVGFYTAVGAGIAGYMMGDVNHIVTPIIILSLILVGVTHIMDHLLLIEAPEKNDATHD